MINLSLGGPSALFLAEQVDAAHAAGSLVVASMGNHREEGNDPQYPAALNHVLAVAATGPTDVYAPYSQSGAHCDVSAPGGAMTRYQDPDNKDSR